MIFCNNWLNTNLQTQMKKISVAVSGLNAIDSPGPGISVIRALKESSIYDVRVIGLAYENLEPGIYMRNLVDKTFTVPLPSAGAEALFNRLAYINSVEKIDVLIPNFDSELFNYIKLSERLKLELKISTFLPTLSQFEERQKTNLFEFGKKHRINIPKSKTVYSVAELYATKNEISFPQVIKGKFYDAIIAYTSDEAISAFNRIAGKWGLPIIVQEFIEGEEVNVTAIGNGKGETIGAVQMKKQFITDKGKAWAGISINDTELLKLTEQLILSTKWRGGLELELVKTEKDEYYLLEINPRFPAWIYLAIGCGQNHPEKLVQMALGESTSAFTSFEVGKLFVRYSYDLIVNLSDFEKISISGEL